MTRVQLEHIIRAAGAIAGVSKLVIIGSQSILGTYPRPSSAALVASMEADLFPLDDPELAHVIDAVMGQESSFHITFGYFADGVGPETAILPNGWEKRLIPISNENTTGVTGFCLEPHDLAASKLAAGRPKDLEFVEALFSCGYIEPGTLRDRVSTLKLEPGMAALASARMDQFEKKYPQIHSVQQAAALDEELSHISPPESNSLTLADGVTISTQGGDSIDDLVKKKNALEQLYQKNTQHYSDAKNIVEPLWAQWEKRKEIVLAELSRKANEINKISMSRIFSLEKLKQEWTKSKPEPRLIEYLFAKSESKHSDEIGRWQASAARIDRMVSREKSRNEWLTQLTTTDEGRKTLAEIAERKMFRQDPEFARATVEAETRLAEVAKEVNSTQTALYHITNSIERMSHNDIDKDAAIGNDRGHDHSRS